MLPEIAFNRYGERRQWWCRECYRQYFRDRGDLHRQQSQAAKERRRSEAGRLVQDHLRCNPCFDCGEADATVLEFDHTGEKRGDVSRLRWDAASPTALQTEISVCEVVCVNCHRRRTAAGRGSWRTDPGRLETDPNLSAEQARNLMYVREALSGAACVDCGLADLLVLEFDHVSTKAASVSRLAHGGYSMKRLQDEISRCQIRCANCHRRRTRERKAALSP